MSDDYWEVVTDSKYITRPATDQFRYRYVDRDGQWTEWGSWQNAYMTKTVGEWLSSSSIGDYEFRRPRQPTEITQPPEPPQPEPQPQDDWEPITDHKHTLRIGIDQMRWRMRSSETGIWTKWTAWESCSSEIRVCDLPKDETAWQCRRPKQQPAPEQAATAGSKYKRQLRQTLPDGRTGASVIVDIYDILRAWDVRDPAIQHAIKKLLQPGQRGSKSAVQDLREAIGSIERAIQLMEGEQ